jgi:hypothetical protein
MIALSSIDPETSMLEVGENAMDRIGAVWPSYTCSGIGVDDEVIWVPGVGLS